jgi:hypothetical protein
MAGGGPVGKADVEELRAVLDGEGAKLKAVMKELEERKKREREEKRRREKGISLGVSSGMASVHAKTATPNPSVGTPGMEQTPRAPQQGQGPQQGSRPATGTPVLPPGPRHPLPLNPTVAVAAASTASPANAPSTSSLPSNPSIPQKPSAGVTASVSLLSNPSVNGASLPEKPLAPTKARPPPSLVRARLGVARAAPMSTQARYGGGGKDGSPSSSTPVQGGGSSWVASRDKERGRGRGTYRGSHRPVMDRWPLSPMVDREREREWDTYVPGSPMDRDFSRSRSRSRSWSRSGSRSRSRSRSLSPRYGRGRDRNMKMGPADREKEHEGVVDELAKNGKEHLRMSLMSGSVREEDVRAFFEGFKVDKVRFLR